MPAPSLSNQASHHIPIKGGKLYVETQGQDNKPAIILLVGLGMQLTDWPPSFIQSLTQRYLVVTLDNRDMGLSSRFTSPPAYTLTDMRDDVYQVVDYLGLEQYTCVGFSMGGMIAQLVAAGDPARVKAMVQMCSGSDRLDMGSSPDCQGRMLRVAQCPDDPASLLAVHMDDCQFYASPLQLDSQQLQQELDVWLKRGFSQAGYRRQWQAIEDYQDRASTLQQIRCPCLIIGAEQDPCIAVSHSYRAHELIADSQLIIVPEVGHWLHESIYQPALDWL